MNIPGAKKSHRERKNPRSAEQHQARKHAANAARGKQVAETSNLIPGRHAYADAKYRHVRIGEAT
jgi:hypothetical protein